MITACLYFCGLLLALGVVVAIVQTARDVSDRAASSRPHPIAVKPNEVARARAAAGRSSAPLRPARAMAGQNRETLLRSAVAELREIGEADALYQGGGWNSRVRDIGRLLDESGGMALMKTAHAAFSRAVPQCSRELDVAWDGIGGWLG